MGPSPVPRSPSIKPQSSRSHLSRVDEGLQGVTGAQKVISQLNAQRSAVTKLTLNHNPLGDDGVSHIFNYLRSASGSRHRTALSEIYLNCAEVGCKGLLAISEYIRGNEVLNVLWLASNVLLPDPVAFSSLASAINDSRLRFLSLTGNNQLGDAFVEHFLPSLRSRYLHELHINAIGLTTQSTSIIGSWISAPLQRSYGGVCHLQVFKSSGNSLGVGGVWEIIRAIERGNWSMTRVEIYANQLISSSDLPENETAGAMKDAKRALHRVLMRNGYRKRQTEREALLLLRYSRPLLMHSRFSSSPSRSTSPPLRTATSMFPFYALPNELKVYILGFLAPSLSRFQRMRIYHYASDTSTLPCLLPPLQSHLGRAECSNTANSSGQRSVDGKPSSTNSIPLVRREEERAKFLEVVHCSAYEPERKNQD